MGLYTANGRKKDAEYYCKHRDEYMPDHYGTPQELTEMTEAFFSDLVTVEHLKCENERINGNTYVDNELHYWNCMLGSLWWPLNIQFTRALFLAHEPRIVQTFAEIFPGHRPANWWLVHEHEHEQKKMRAGFRESDPQFLVRKNLLLPGERERLPLSAFTSVRTPWPPNARTYWPDGAIDDDAYERRIATFIKKRYWIKRYEVER